MIPPRVAAILRAGNNLEILYEPLAQAAVAPRKGFDTH